jgi:hypothetical protein
MTPGGGVVRVCLVKQRGCYDLYTVTGPDATAIARSSACRSGPLGLWDWPGFSVSFRVLADCDAPECRVGPDEWAPYVEGKVFRSFEGVPDDPRAVDWDEYDIVISVDVAVPSDVVRAHPGVLWCQYFIEGGVWGIDEQWADAPQYGYNVFLDHRPATRLLTPRSATVRRLARTRRTVLDFPYYLLSDETLARLYRPAAAAARAGSCLASSSRAGLDPALRRGLERLGPLRDEYETPAELHAAMAASRYFVVTPGSPSKTGGALVDAVSAGCVVLAPAASVRHFRQITAPWLDYGDRGGLLRRLDALERDPGLYRLARDGQAAVVRRTFWEYPLRNLEVLRASLTTSRAGDAAQRRAERRAVALAPLRRLPTKARRRLRRYGLGGETEA